MLEGDDMGAAIALVREHHETYRQAAHEAGFDPARAHQELLTLARRRAADDVAMLEPLLVAHEGRVHVACVRV